MPRPPATMTRAGSGLEVVATACRAPSIHNSQPWWWRVSEGAIELHADRTRRLPHADPLGRNLLISCGSALHHVQVAARGLGWEPTVERWPMGTDSDLLARVSLEPRVRTTGDAVLLRALRARRTDRRRFTSWPVQGRRLDQLVEVATSWGAEATSVDIVDRVRIERMVARAHVVQAADPALVAEHREWTDRGSEDGVLAELVPPTEGEDPTRQPRFPEGTLDDRDHVVQASDGIIVLSGSTDDRRSWLTTGEALGAVWLHAVTDGLSIVPLSQVVEVDSTRMSLQHEVLLGQSYPQLLLRVGWQAIGRDELKATPRRPLSDVVRP
ncbi:Acg family FMN-binding oxidoreductase [Nocardioides plantarum]|uniref:Acg family FMN-binding oxidoreductase n=1 Tax=Nocardioides plantarum TaxID=29299 RepID=A0ABV5K7U9_9ACTN|nr:NAD(P)H nitroreductase [Nocardioides plantarum]